MADKNKKIGGANNLPKEAQIKRLRVPKANIIDLRKVQEQKKQLKDARQESTYWERLKNIQWPKMKMPSVLFVNREKTREKVIISQSKDIPKKEMQKSASLPPVPEEKIDFKESQLSPGWYKKLLGFALVCLMIILPIYLIPFYQRATEAKGEVLGISSQGYQYLQEAGGLASQSDYNLASQSFSRAGENFLLAKQQLEGAGGIIVSLTGLIPGKVKSAQHLLEAGDNLSQAGAGLTSLIGDLDNLDLNPLASNTSSLTDFLVLISDSLLPVQENLNQAVTNLEQVRINDLPSEYQSSMAEVKETLPKLQDNFQDFFSTSDVLLEVLGRESPKRYLFVFQNDRELRPTGGFIGSIALVDIYKGQIKNLEVPGGGVYDVAGQLHEKIIAPKPLWLVNPHWNIQDANWFVDFPSSADKLMWFFERTGKTTVDGIIALTPQVIEGLLKVVGPLDMTEDYGIIVDHNNFIRHALTWAEVEYDREENKPKKFIGDLLPILLNKAFQVKGDNLLQVVSTLINSLADKNILLYFSDDSLEQRVKQLGWDGSVKESDKDYLLVVSTNIAGGKTDHVVDQLVAHEVEIKSDGSIIDTVTVTRAHRGNPLDLWEGVTNVSYLRFYVPPGSRLLSVAGFTSIPSFRYQLPDEGAVPDEDLLAVEEGSIIDERSNTRITSEFNKTVFGNWLTIEPGQVKQVQIKYQLPFKLEAGGLLSKTDDYSLLVQKQPGMNTNYFVSRVTLAPDYEVLWYYPAWRQKDYTLEYITDLDSDKYLGILLNK